MHIKPIAQLHDPLRSRMPDLIGLAGSAQFEAELFAILNRISSCRHFTVFRHEGDEPPEVAMALNDGSDFIARSIAAKYLGRHWRLDPISMLRDQSIQSGTISVINDVSDIDDADYRQDCYTSVGLRNRLTIWYQQGNDLTRLGLYVGPSGFSDQSIEAICASSDILVAAIHLHLARTARQPQCLDDMRDRVAASCRALPLREAEVCAAIILGLSTEGIALTLGIASGTVQTYRKRAYARLQISSQNELMRLVLQ